MKLGNNQNGKLFVFSGPSGAGKGTICAQVISDASEKDMQLSVSMTTRDPRVGEIEGKSYYFVSTDNFERAIERDEFLEYAKVYDNYYGTPKKMVTKKLTEGTDVVLEIDIQGALQVKENYPQAILVFILPPSMEVLRKRLVDRDTDSMEVIEKRLSKTIEELSFLDRYDYLIINDDLERAVCNVKSIIKSEHLRVSDEVDDIIKNFKEEA